MTVSTRARSRPSTSTVIRIGLVLAFLVAGVVSYYASTSPDGLERVAETLGFGHHARSGGAPLPHYQTPGIDDPRLSGGLAGVLGAATVLLVTGLLVAWLRRKQRR